MRISSVTGGFFRLSVLAVAGLAVGLGAAHAARAAYHDHLRYVEDVAQRAIVKVEVVQAEHGLPAEQTLLAAALDGAAEDLHAKPGQATQINGCYTFWGSQQCPYGRIMYKGRIIIHGSGHNVGTDTNMCWDERILAWDGNQDPDDQNVAFHKMHSRNNTGNYTYHLSNMSSGADSPMRCVVCCGP